MLRCADCAKTKSQASPRKKKPDTLLAQVKAERRRWDKTKQAPGGHLRIDGGASRLCEEPGFSDIKLPPGSAHTKGCERCAEVKAIALRELDDWLVYDAEWLLHKEETDGLTWDKFEDVQERQRWRAEAVSHVWYGYSEARNQARFEASIFGDDSEEEKEEDDLDEW